MTKEQHFTDVVDILENMDHLPSELASLIHSMKDEEMKYQSLRRTFYSKKKEWMNKQGIAEDLACHDLDSDDDEFFLLRQIQPEHHRSSKDSIPFLRELLMESQETMDQKIKLGGLAKETLSKYLQILDSDIERYSIAVQEEASEKNTPGRPRIRRIQSVEETCEKNDEDKENVPLAVNADGEDGPLDEPLYCICQQVSYGDMVECDGGETCPYGWFHYACVGLNSPPKGSWFCSECLLKSNKK